MVGDGTQNRDKDNVLPRRIEGTTGKEREESHPNVESIPVRDED